MLRASHRRRERWTEEAANQQNPTMGVTRTDFE
jgi:hypothetical protein